MLMNAVSKLPVRDVNELSQKIIGCAYTVSNTLGMLPFDCPLDCARGPLRAMDYVEPFDCPLDYARGPLRAMVS